MQAILNDLINQTKVPESKKLAEVVQKNLIQELKKKYSPKKLRSKKGTFSSIGRLTNAEYFGRSRFCNQ